MCINKEHFVLLMSVYFILGGAAAVPLLDGENVEAQQNIPFASLLKHFEKCQSEGGITGIVNCAASRIVRALHKAEDQQSLEILPGISLIRNEGAIRNGRELKLENLPSDPNQRSSQLLDMLLDSATSFFTARTFKIKLDRSNGQRLARAFEEGRGKMKKVMGPFMLGIGAKMLTVVPIMMSGVAFLAAKALIVGKLAFVISLILLVQYILAGRWTSLNQPFYGYGNVYGSGYGGYGTNNLGGYSSQYPYARSIDVSSDVGQNLAYSAGKL